MCSSLGIFVALALRFDVSKRSQPKYFTSAFVGYVVGVVLTIVVMNWFQAAQVSFSYVVMGICNNFPASQAL